MCKKKNPPDLQRLTADKLKDKTAQNKNGKINENSLRRALLGYIKDLETKKKL